MNMEVNEKQKFIFRILIYGFIISPVSDKYVL